MKSLLLTLSLFSSLALAEDWGAYQIVSASAPEFVLEAVVGTQEGDVVSIQKPNGAANQKWIFDPKGDGWYGVMPVSTPTLALTAVNDEKKNGAKVTIEKYNKSDAQLWSIQKHDNGSYTLTPKHAAGMGLDHFGGKKEAGAKVDLWTYRENDTHLQWFIHPLAGTGIAETKKEEAPSYIAPEIAPEAIQEGSIKEFNFTQSKVFPGTVRDVTVFIPAQYEASKPACVYVKTDGYNPREKALLETMIATGEIPVTVGGFCQTRDTPRSRQRHS